jgi:hypothetical protein
VHVGRDDLERLAAGYLLGFLEAEVVATTLQDREVDVDPEVLRQEGQVLAGQLVLERLGRGGYHHLLPREDGRYEVGERLAGPGARLDDQVPARHDRAPHGLGHLDLTRPGLAPAGKRGRDPGEGGGHRVRGGHGWTLPSTGDRDRPR